MGKERENFEEVDFIEGHGKMECFKEWESMRMTQVIIKEDF